MNAFEDSMPGTNTVSPSVRRAALLLHALAPNDRSWILERLPPSERETAVELLRELQVLGIPEDQGLVRDFISTSSNRGGSPFPTQEEIPSASYKSGAYPATEDDVRKRLRQINVLELAIVLRNEPCMIICRLLQIEEWPWRDQLLEHLGAVQRRRVSEMLMGLDPAPACATFQSNLLAELMSRLTSQSPASMHDLSHSSPLRGSRQAWSWRNLFIWGQSRKHR